MIAGMIITAAAGMGLGVLQSTLLSQIMPLGIVPDLALLTIIAYSWSEGSLGGEIVGFAVGLGFDALSLAPLGFHAFLFTVAGYAFGRLKGNISPGPVFLPAAAAVSATLVKYGGSFILAVIFGLNSVAIRNFSINTLWEALVNAILAPLVFLAYRVLARLAEGNRGGFR